MKHTMYALLCAATVAGAAPSDSQSPAPASKALSNAKQKAVTWAGVKWHPLADARKKARAGRTARPILYLRMLGELKGKT